MAYSAKLAKPRMLSTYVDVITRIRQCKSDTIDLSDSSVVSTIFTQADIENFIIASGAEVSTALRRWYSDTNLRISSPWASIPFPDNSNTGTGSLLSVYVSQTTAYTAGWKIAWSGTAAANVAGAGATIYVLDADATFNIAYDSNVAVACTVDKDDTTGNTTMDQLVANVQTAVNTSLTAGKVTVTHSLLKLVFTSVSSGLGSSVNITRPDAVTVAELGISASATFALTSSLEGSQGTAGTTGADKTSTNSDVVIPATAWSGTPATGDNFYFSIIDCYPIIWMLTTELSVVRVLENLYQQAEPGQITYDMKLKAKVAGILGRLNQPYEKDGLRLDSFTPISGQSIWIDYDVTDTGADISSYLTLNEEDYI